jgi:hypothetical protein
MAKQKKWVVLLLIAACIFSGALLLTTEPVVVKKLERASQIDSLITQTFDLMNISEQQVRRRTIQIDSVFARQVYTVDVPRGFSKTQFHYELDKVLRPYQVETPSRVIFPERDMHIHLLYRNTIQRSVILRTDPELMMHRDLISLVISFDRRPSSQVLDRIIAMGEPIRVAVKNQSIVENLEMMRELRRQYPQLDWWLLDQNGNNYERTAQMDAFSQELNRLSQIDPVASVLFFNPYDGNTPQSMRNRLRATNVQLLEIRSPVYLSNLDDQNAVSSTMDEMLTLAGEGESPVLILNGTDSNIRNLQTFIVELKREGARLRSPGAL